MAVATYLFAPTTESHPHPSLADYFISHSKRYESTLVAEATSRRCLCYQFALKAHACPPQKR
eukprot:1145073-Pelagomonas_calceolata.AAC.1